MKTSLLFVLFSGLLVNGGCSGDEVCRLTDYPDVDLECRDVLRMSADNTLGLRPTQDEVDARGPVIELARTADARFERVHDYAPWSRDSVVIQTDREQLAMAWRRGDVLTGSSDVDPILVESGAVAVERNGEDQFILRFATPISLNNLQTVLVGLGGFNVSSADSGEIGDGELRLPGDNQVQFVVGWGTCFVGCPYQHWWTVEVSIPDDFAVVIREGGDPLPPEWQ